MMMMTLGRVASTPWRVFLGFALSPDRIVMMMMTSKDISQTWSLMMKMMRMMMTASKVEISPNHCHCSACYGISWCHIQPCSNQLSHSLQISCRIPMPRFVFLHFCFFHFCTIFLHFIFWNRLFVFSYFCMLEFLHFINPPSFCHLIVVPSHCLCHQKVGYRESSWHSWGKALPPVFVVVLNQ